MTAGADLASLAAAVPDAVVARLAAARSVLAVGHENPDADALGAALAVAILVRARGGRATVAVSDGVPALYRFLPGADTVRTDPEPGVAYDLVVLCDCGDLSRAGAIRDRNADLFAAHAAPHPRPPREQRRVGRPRLDRPRRGGHLRDGRPRRGAPRCPARRGRRGASPRPWRRGS